MHERQVSVSAVLALEFEGARHAVRLVLERGRRGSFGGMFVE